MSWTLALAVAVGGAIGAPLRLLIDTRVMRTLSESQNEGQHVGFPWGLLAVNALGSLFIGIAYASIDGHWRALIATGACGALTTYSSYALFINRAWSENRKAVWQAVIAMPVVCITVVAIAVAITP
jgi:CrcB protein